MKAVLVKADRALSWESVPDPIVQPDEVLVKIQYAALNRADLMQREGLYPRRRAVPMDGAGGLGTVVGLGSEAAQSRWKLGDRVCALLGAADTPSM